MGSSGIGGDAALMCACVLLQVLFGTTSIDGYQAVGTPTGLRAIYHEYVPYVCK